MSVMAVESLSVRYGRTPVLDDVSFEVSQGSVFVLLGRNGAGKSSLVRCALGQQKPARGRATLFGADAWRTRARAMARVGVVPEEPDAPPEMTARQLAAFCRKLYPKWSDETVTARLRRFDVPDSVPFGRLSKGQKGAVLLALCLASSPELLILDDPTLGLDVVARKALYDELIGELADRGVTVFLTTHDLAGVEALGSRVGILKGTRLVVEENLESLKQRFRRLRAPKAGPVADWGPFTVVSQVHREWGEEAVVSDFDDERLGGWRASHQSAAIDADVLSLEEVFVAVTGQEGAAR